MGDQNILTDATGFSKDELKTNAQNLVTGCVATNTNFTFSDGSYDLLVTRNGDWVDKNSKGEVSGDHVLIQKANDAEILLIASYKDITEQVNKQANHDLVKLKSSGGILTDEGGPLGVLKQAVIVSVTSTIAEEILITLLTYEQSVGTMVYWRDLTANTPQDKDFFAQKKNIILDGLISGHQYEIIVAHKGVVRKVITSNPVKVSVQ